MRIFGKVFRLVCAASLGVAVMSSSATGQQLGTPQQDTPVEDLAVGTQYVSEIHGDWTVRCLKQETGSDPCSIFQLLLSASGAPVAELSLFPTPVTSNEVVAVATITAPLMTLLPSGVVVGIDGEDMRRYPFDFCSTVGCVSRIALSRDILDAFFAGERANITIVSAERPEQPVRLESSLDGFSTGFATLLP